MAAIVELEDVGLTFAGASKPIFEHIDLTLERGDFVTLVGASGAGKSSLIRVVAGLMAASAGEVRLAVEHRRDRRAIAMVFQEARLMPWRRVAQNVALGLEGLQLTSAARDQRIADALALVRLDGLADRWPHELSGGQRQRVGIARALAVAPDLLLMDEPFGALDAITRQTLQDEFVEIRRATGCSILFVTHDIDEAVYLGDRVLLLGGTPARLMKAYAVAGERSRSRVADASLRIAARVRSDLQELFAHGAGI